MPRSLAWLFPEVALGALDPARDARFILARVLESGTLADVAWCVQRYGLVRIHEFFRDEGDPTLSPRTIALWRAALDARGESWKTSPRSHLDKAAPWLS
jgi:hypothetical protein